MGNCPLFCQCDYCTAKIAVEHEDGDSIGLREWSCQCGACKRTRYTPSIAACMLIIKGLMKLERLDAERARVMAINRWVKE